jgi:hypothetical protein
MSWLFFRRSQKHASRPAPRVNRRGRAAHWRPNFEILEGRVLPSTVRWTSPAGGNWATASNWSTGTVPGSSDDVIINLSGNTFAVTHSAGTDTVHSLDNHAALAVTGSSLTVTAAFTDSDNGAVSVDQSGTFQVNGTATVDGTGSRTLTFQADHSSRLIFTQVTQWIGAGGINDGNRVNVDASNGGTVTLAGLTQITTGNTYFYAAGSGSQINLPALTSFTAARNDASFLRADGGTIAASSLASLNGVSLYANGTGSQLPTAHLTSFLNGNLYTDNGASLALPMVASIAGPSSASLNFQADHGSQLDLSHVTAWQGAGGANDGNRINVDASNGATINLSGLTRITTGNTYFYAAGSGSQINLAGLTAFTASRNDASFLRADAGAITAGSLASLNGVSLYANATGSQLPTAQVTSFQNGNLYTDNGATLSLPALTSIAGPSNFSLNFQADHGSQLDLSHVTAWQGAGGANDGNRINVDASNGATINLSGLTQISGGNTYFLSQGTNSLIKLETLTSFRAARSDSSFLAVTTAGAIGNGALTTLDHVTLSIQGAGTIGTDHLTTATNGVIAVRDGVHLSLDSLTNMDGSVMSVHHGAHLQILNVKTYNAAPGCGGTPPPGYQTVGDGDGEGDPDTDLVCDIITITIPGCMGGEASLFRAIRGAKVHLPCLKTIRSSVGFQAQNPGSLIDLPMLDEYRGMDQGHSIFQATDSGVIQLRQGNPGTTRLANAGITLDAGGQITADTVELDTNGFLNGTGTLNGNLILNGGVLNVQAVNGPITVTGSLTQTGGSVIGPGTLNVSGLLSWQAGLMSDTGTTNANGGADLSGVLKSLNRRTFNNAGSGTWTAGDLDMGNGATFNNLVTGSLTIGGDPSILNATGGAATFTNSGLLAKSGGTGVTEVQTTFANLGTLQVASGTVSLTGAFSGFGGSTLNQGTYLIAATFQFLGANIVTNAATVVLDGPAAAILDDLDNNALANFAVNRGHFTVTDGATITTAGDFENGGTLTLGPGGVFNVSGNYTQDGPATLEVQLGGTADTGLYGQLNVAGQANLAGTLQVTPVNGYTPASGDAFQFFTFATRGGTDFDTYPNGFDLNYDDVGGSLTIVAQ